MTNRCRSAKVGVLSNLEERGANVALPARQRAVFWSTKAQFVLSVTKRIDFLHNLPKLVKIITFM